ncbi:NYN domain-containing protein [Pseudolysinimonas sp.]|uniref:NYN domain-containing protein n=1 Tax=Pseudolysinimonas sp. TaxID=2680009 RepID=UPI003F7E136D
MAEPSDGRVGVYLDFDNVVISRYDQLFGRGDFYRDNARRSETDTAKQRLEEARVDIGAILDYATSFGTLAVTKAYADWSAPVNANYRSQLVNRAVDLVQLFPVTSGGKNGADIRLAVDVLDDLFRFDDLSTVVLVAGDSDYIALAQRSRKLGRTVIGIGVAGATSRALMAACDEFIDYDALPGVEPHAPAPRRAEKTAPAVEPEPAVEEPVEPDAEAPESSTPEGATALLLRALRVVESRGDDDWASNSQLKNQMLRIDPTFNEKTLGFSTFTKFLDSRTDVIRVKKDAAPNGPRVQTKR